MAVMITINLAYYWSVILFHMAGHGLGSVRGYVCFAATVEPSTLFAIPTLNVTISLKKVYF